MLDLDVGGFLDGGVYPRVNVDILGVAYPCADRVEDAPFRGRTPVAERRGLAAEATLLQHQLLQVVKHLDRTICKET